MKVSVIGASGTTGLLTTQKLLRDGHEVTCMVRNDDHNESIINLGVNLIVGNLENPETLSVVAQNQDAVIFCAGSGGKRLKEVDQQGAISMANAAVQAGVSRFVMLSSFFTGHPEEGPESIKLYLQAKLEADRYIMSSELEYTIVRPSWLTNDEETGNIDVSEYFNDDKASNSRGDVAEVLVQVLKIPGTLRKTFEIRSGKTSITEALQNINKY